VLHRDSLGYVQPIRPNEINWMTAGRGIVHSERTPPEIRAAGHTLHALQLWVALPSADEETDPAFFHYDANELPEVHAPDKSIRVMIGAAYGVSSPVQTWSSTLYIEVNLNAGASFTLPGHIEEKAIYLVAGALKAGEKVLPRHSMVIFDDSKGIEVTAEEDSRLVIIGGASLGKRTVWWNLVASRKELIEQAKEDWQAGRFPKVPGEVEFIPLP
jgi:redox-sensitive bicupin YhaK (pirin superfamily)